MQRRKDTINDVSLSKVIRDDANVLLFADTRRKIAKGKTRRPFENLLKEQTRKWFCCERWWTWRGSIASPSSGQTETISKTLGTFLWIPIYSDCEGFVQTVLIWMNNWRLEGNWFSRSRYRVQKCVLNNYHFESLWQNYCDTTNMLPISGMFHTEVRVALGDAAATLLNN